MSLELDRVGRERELVAVPTDAIPLVSHLHHDLVGCSQPIDEFISAARRDASAPPSVRELTARRKEGDQIVVALCDKFRKLVSPVVVIERRIELDK